MADLKISQLSSATALAGTDVVPVVQGGSTKKATIDQILSPAAGGGVNFSASSHTAGMTSELLNDYEEGTWTPVVTALSGTITTLGTVTGRYTKIGRVVNLFWQFGITNNGTGASAIVISGLPFNASTAFAFYSGCGYANNTGKGLTQALQSASGPIYVRVADGTYPGATGEILYGSIAYEV